MTVLVYYDMPLDAAIHLPPPQRPETCHDHVVAGGGRPVDRIASVHFGPARNAAGYESGWFRKMEVFFIWIPTNT